MAAETLGHRLTGAELNIRCLVVRRLVSQLKEIKMNFHVLDILPSYMGGGLKSLGLCSGFCQGQERTLESLGRRKFFVGPGVKDVNLVC